MRIDQVLMLIQYLCLACERSGTEPRMHYELTNLQISNAGFSALRVYALLDGKYLIAGIVLLLNLVPFATNMVSTTMTKGANDDLYTRLKFSYVTSVVLNDAEACKAVPQSSNNLLLM